MTGIAGYFNGTFSGPVVVEYQGMHVGCCQLPQSEGEALKWEKNGKLDRPRGR
jgi:hypothetical protein